MNITTTITQHLRDKVSHSTELASKSISTILRIHDQYSTIIGATQPLFDGVADSMRNVFTSFWNSKPVTIAAKAITGSINQSKIVQSGLQKIVTIITHKNPLSVRVKKHLLNQDPKIKRIQNIISNLEDKIQASYCKVFNKPILMDKMKFSFEEYQTMTKHFQEFLSKNESCSISCESTLADVIEDLIEFIENDTLPESQEIKEEIINIVEKLSPSISESNDSSNDEKVIEAAQAFQNCYFLFLSKELLRKFEKGEIYKDDLLVFLKNYKTSPITSLINDATIENIGEVCAGMIGEAITESSLATAFHRQIDKRVLGPILSMSPLHSLLGTFSSYLGITLSSYVGIKILGSEESLKDYVHNMTWAMLASMVTEYGLEVSQISNPIYTFLVPLIASSIAYNFSATYEPLLKRKYLTETLSENYPQLVEIMENLAEEKCIVPVKEQVQNIDVQQVRRLTERSISENIMNGISQNQIFVHIQRVRSLFDLIKDPLTNLLNQVSGEAFMNNLFGASGEAFINNLFTEASGEALKDLLLNNSNSKQSRKLVNHILTKDFLITSFLGRFSQFYEKLINDEKLLKYFYDHRSQIIEISSTRFSSNTNINDMPDMQDVLIKLICSISPSQGNSSIPALLLTQIDEVLPTSLFQSFSKNLEKSLESQIHPFSTMDPLFLEVVVKSFVVTTLLEVKDLRTDIIHTDTSLLQNTLQLVDTLIHINLIGQNDEKNPSIIGYIVYKFLHAEINTAIQSVPEMLEETA